ncbi:hypothetical protein D3C85_1489160 [compost metagenome]
MVNFIVILSHFIGQIRILIEVGLQGFLNHDACEFGHSRNINKRLDQFLSFNPQRYFGNINGQIPHTLQIA